MNDRHPIVATDGRYDYRVMELVGHEPGGELYTGEAVGRAGTVPVSIRTFSDRDLVDARFRDRLLEAVKLHRSVQHPAIHPIRSFIELHHAPAIVSAPIEGRRLADLLRDGPLPARAAAAMVEQTALAIVAEQDGVWVDVLVRAAEVGTARARIALDRPDVTGQAPVPGYVAPERRGGTTGRDRPESDVYGLAVVMLQALSGLHPKPLPDEAEAHAQAAQAALAELSKVPEPIRVLLGEMLAFDPDERPAAREVARRLRALVPDLPGPWLSAWTGERIDAPAPMRPPPPTAVYAEVEDDESPTEQNPEARPPVSNVEALRPLRKATAEERSAKRRRAAIATAGWILAGAGLFTALYLFIMKPEWVAQWTVAGGGEAEMGADDGGEPAAGSEPTASGEPPDPDTVQVIEIDPDDAPDVIIRVTDGDDEPTTTADPATARPATTAPEGPDAPPTAGAPDLELPAAPAADGPDAPPAILASTRAEPTRDVPHVTRRQLQRKVRLAAPAPEFGANPDVAPPNAPRVAVEVFAPMAEEITLVCANDTRVSDEAARVQLDSAPVGRCDVQAMLSGKPATGTFQLDGDRRVECRIDFADKLRCW